MWCLMDTELACCFDVCFARLLKKGNSNAKRCLALLSGSFIHILETISNVKFVTDPT